MKITITIKTDNDAFAEDLKYEVARILTGLGEKFLNNYYHESDANCIRKLHDINGQTCGSIILKS